MKTIERGTPPCCLINANKNGWNWENFHENDQKGYISLKEQMLLEQSNECAYTGLWLGSGTKYKIHIDHFRKKGIYQNLTFEYDNLFVAAKELNCGADYKDNQIHGPQDNSDKQYNEILSPLEINIKKYFWYRSDGHIVPADNLTEKERNKAQKTIEIFNLNDIRLRNKRTDLIFSLHDMNDLDDDIIREAMKEYGFSFVVDFILSDRDKIGKG